MDDYNKYLADNVLVEDKVVTYRLLSRQLKVHVNTAKQMLYDFHKSQNCKKPGSVHATYLVYGTKASAPPRPQAGGDGDIEMTSSFPDTDSAAEVVPSYTMMLIQEGKLNEALADYDEVASIHVYSVGPHPAKDLALLSDVARQVLNLQAADDSPATRKLYGVIPNPHVRRRERRGPGPKATVAAIKQEPKPAAKPAPKPVATAEKIKESNPSAAETPTSSSVPTKKPIPALKKGNSGIMQAFSKAAAKPQKPKEPEPVDTPMSDDGEDDDIPQPQARQSTSGRKSRKEREDELKRMMEEDVDDEDDEKEEEEEEEEEEAAVEEEPVEEPAEEQATPAAAKEGPREIISASGDGRRRGKRRVMKKKQITDDQGYLVTIQEPGWESFSEDEAPPAPAQKPKPAAGPAPPPAAGAKGKKSGPKTGQGSIMSFFSKK